MMTSAVETRLPHRLPQLIEAQGLYTGKFNDRTPHIKSAGKLTSTGDTVPMCLQTQQRPPTPPEVSKFYESDHPDAGKASVFYGRAYDPHRHWAKEMRHGVLVHPSGKAGDMVNPQPKTLVQQRALERKESCYASHKAPLGQTPDPRPAFPEGCDIDNKIFGIKTIKGVFASELINPDKDFRQVYNDTEQGRDLYRLTHKDFRPGEQCRRNYTTPSYDINRLYGYPTPHDSTGKQTKETMHWLHESRCAKATPIASKRAEDFRERTQPQLGQVLDPMKDTRRVGPDHTYGMMVKPDEYGAGDLLHWRAPGTYLRGHDRQRGLIAAMRQHLKKENYHKFNDLLNAFHHYDSHHSGKLTKDDLREVCIQFNLPAEPQLLDQLMDYCDIDGNGLIDYTEFANFLNWKDKMPSTEREPGSGRGETPARLTKQIDGCVGAHGTSAALINATVGGVNTADFRKYGIPSVRSDLPAPIIRRLDDRTNYGHDSTVYGLINPSMYSTKGVYERDFLRPRSKDEIQSAFTNIGLRMEQNDFDNLYRVASSSHPKGHVSVESFRDLLDKGQMMTLANSSGIVY